MPFAWLARVIAIIKLGYENGKVISGSMCINGWLTWHTQKCGTKEVELGTTKDPKI